jgi:hypothetical protein
VKILGGLSVEQKLSHKWQMEDCADVNGFSTLAAEASRGQPSVRCKKKELGCGKSFGGNTHATTT